jgi:histidinol phosphatase-like enzyme|tara:strand:- start:235 stop:480 length:246 start_codon:yes stop_codon:yes gene_type:complete
MREMLLAASKSYYVGMINKHISNVEILLTRSVGIGEHQDIQQAIDAELEKVSVADDKLNMILKYFERKKEDEKEEEKSKSK